MNFAGAVDALSAFEAGRGMVQLGLELVLIHLVVPDKLSSLMAVDMGSRPAKSEYFARGFSRVHLSLHAE